MRSEKHNTQKSLGFLIEIGQCLLLMPVKNVNRNSLKFEWLYWKTLASLIFTVVSLVQAMLFFNYFLLQEQKFSSSSGLTFYITVPVFRILFIDTARKWPKVMKKWTDVDVLMQNYIIVENYRFKMQIVSLALLALALSEHLFFILSLGIFFSGSSFMEELQNYFLEIFKFIFMVFPYNIGLAVFVQILNSVGTIIWNYIDVFLISLSIAYVYRLKQMENKISIMVKYKIQGISYWKEIRDHYGKLTDLCNELENCISPLILVSFVNKLYVVLYQLFGLLSGEKYATQTNFNAVNRLYYAFSFLYILLRLAGVIFFASAIDMKSHDIAETLFAASSEVYNDEIDMLITGIRFSPPILSGAKIFQIKKSLLLKIASSIIIYELVMIKFLKYQ